MSGDFQRRTKVAVIGATGSVGTSVLDVCRAHPERLAVHSLAAHSSAKKLESLAEEFCTRKLCLYGGGDQVLAGASVMTGSEGLIALAEDPEVEHVVFASSGTDAIPALQAALRAGKTVSLANKESIVVAGEWILPLVTRGDQLRPLDSEHNAIWQCMQGEVAPIERIYLTASGGPFRTWDKTKLETVTPEMALMHPTWSMGAKLTVDSATLMNKGIELIEAMILFGLEHHQVEALVSPGSFVHGIVEFGDGSIKMLASMPDMRLPAASCLLFPERRRPCEALSSTSLVGRTIAFEAPDEERFPSVRLAHEVMKKRGAFSAALVGADEVAVEYFLRRRIRFTDIPNAVESALSACTFGVPSSLDEALEVLQWSRGYTDNWCRLHAL